MKTTFETLEPIVKSIVLIAGAIANLEIGSEEDEAYPLTAYLDTMVGVTVLYLKDPQKALELAGMVSEFANRNLKEESRNHGQIRQFPGFLGLYSPPFPPGNSDAGHLDKPHNNELN